MPCQPGLVHANEAFHVDPGFMQTPAFVGSSKHRLHRQQRWPVPCWPTLRAGQPSPRHSAQPSSLIAPPLRCCCMLAPQTLGPGAFKLCHQVGTVGSDVLS